MFAMLLLPVAGESLAQVLRAPTTIELSLGSELSDSYVVEGSGDTEDDTATTTITLTASYPATSATLTVATEWVVTLNGSAEATEGINYQGISATTLTIDANQRSGMVTFNFVTRGNTDVASNPQNVTVNLKPAGSTPIGFTAPTGAILTITDDDTPATVLLLKMDPASVIEGTSTTIIVTAALPPFSPPVENDVHVLFALIDVGTATMETAKDKNDFKVSDTAPRLIIPAGRNVGTGVFVLTAYDDNVLDQDGGANETIFFNPDQGGGGIRSVVPTWLKVEIVDNDS